MERLQALGGSHRSTDARLSVPPGAPSKPGRSFEGEDRRFELTSLARDSDAPNDACRHVSDTSFERHCAASRLLRPVPAREL